MYHKKLLTVPHPLRLTFSSATNKRWLRHLKTAEQTYSHRQMKALMKQPKITEFFTKLTTTTTTTKRNRPPNIQKQKRQRTTLPITNHLKQTTIHGKTQNFTPTTTSKHPPTPTKYNKRKYSDIANYLEGQDRTKLSTITFIEKQVILSSSRAPYFNRFNKKFSNNKPLNWTP